MTFQGHQETNQEYQSVWDLEPISDSPLPELKPIEVTEPAQQQADWSGRMTPPTAVAYQTIDQLSPVHHDEAFPTTPQTGSRRFKARSPKRRQVEINTGIIEIEQDEIMGWW